MSRRSKQSQIIQKISYSFLGPINMAEGEDIYTKLEELKEFYDGIFEYLPPNESKETEVDPKDAQQFPPGQNQLNQKPKQVKEQNESQKPIKPPVMKKQYKDKGSQKRPGFEGLRVIRTKRGAE